MDPGLRGSVFQQQPAGLQNISFIFLFAFSITYMNLQASYTNSWAGKLLKFTVFWH